MKLASRAQHNCLVAAALTAATLTFAAQAGAQPADYAHVPLDPNVVTDSTAYRAAPPTLNPDGQSGVEQVFTHRDDSRQIIDTVLVLADPQAASAVLAGWQSALTPTVPGARTESAPVGESGTLTTGISADGAQSISVVMFTRGSTAAEIQFVGRADDPAPTDLVIEYGQRQDDVIREQLTQ